MSETHGCNWKKNRIMRFCILEFNSFINLLYLVKNIEELISIYQQLAKLCGEWRQKMGSGVLKPRVIITAMIRFLQTLTL